MFYKLISHVLVTEHPNQIQYFSLPGKVSPAKTAKLCQELETTGCHFEKFEAVIRNDEIDVGK